MKRGRHVVLILAALGVAAVWWFRGREPVYRGKALSTWLIAYNQPDPTDPLKKENAADAVHHIGTNGLPFLLRSIEHTGLPWQQRISGRLDSLVSPRLPRTPWFPTPLGVWGFEILGPDASPAIPELTRIAKSGKTNNAEAAIEALGHIGKDALPALLELATNKALEISSRYYAVSAIGGLRYIGTNANAAVPVLVQLLEEPRLRREAAMVLGFLNIESNISVPALAKCLNFSDPGLQGVVLWSLRSFGERARGAVPEVMPLLSNTYAGVRLSATNALEEIAPGLLTNAVSHSH